MVKKTFTDEDVEKLIKENPDFDKISGTFVLSQGSISLGDVSNHSTFICDEKDFNRFISEIMNSLEKLAPISSQDAPLDWAPLPGVNKEKILSRYEKMPPMYRSLIKEDPNILLIQKVADDGNTIAWRTPDGRIGFGGHLF